MIYSLLNNNKVTAKTKNGNTTLVNCIALFQTVDGWRSAKNTLFAA